MIARIVYRVKAWHFRRRLERAHPELRTLRIAKQRASKRHGRTKQIEAQQAAVMNRALGWRGAR